MQVAIVNLCTVGIARSQGLRQFTPGVPRRCGVYEMACEYSLGHNLGGCDD